MVKGEVAGSTECPVRVHSECHTGDVLGSLRCDCGDQLEASLKYIARQGKGVLIYLKQEGRGIGLLSKLKAYSLQDEGLDTVEANEFLGFPAEARDYTAGAAIIRALGIKSVALLTNNPDKVDKLTQAGIEIVRREPVEIEPNQHNSFYMETKKLRMGHLY
ncbi:MAG: GTP cyclohydrolase II [Spirochaetia bacterium]|nr:GTP cyclohydrolase II [Spirochaetia bacterium]